MELSIDAHEWNDMAKRYAGATPIIEQELVKGMTRIAIEGRNQAVTVVPVDTGRLKGSIAYEVTRAGKDVIARVGTNVEYAKPVEFGTAPHIIRPKNKRALYWPGAEHPVALVNHPGTKGKPYLRPALEKMRVVAPRHLGDAARKAIARITGGR